jgi:uncharacterized protein (DUF433 family)
METERRIVPVIKEHIEIVEGALGPKARIAGHNVRVIDIVIAHEQLGQTAAEIVESIPTITRADVYAVLAYYWDNRDEIEQRMADDDAFVEEMMRKDPGRLQALMAARQDDESAIPIV